MKHATIEGGVPQLLSATRAHEPGVLAEYMDYLFLGPKGLKENTAYNYYMSLRMLAKFLQHRRGAMPCDVSEIYMEKVTVEDFACITEDEWYDFLDYCEFTLKERKTSMAVRLSVIHGFYRWLRAEKGVFDKPFIFGSKRPTPVREKEDGDAGIVSKRIAEKLEASVQDDILSARNTCILKLISQYGVGLQEICNMNIEDVKVSSIIVGTPGGSMREIPINEETQSAIDAYIAERIPPKDGSNGLFVSMNRGRIRRSSVEKMVRKAAAKSGHSVTIRELQKAAKANMVKELGVDTAMSMTSVSSFEYFAGSYSVRA